MESFRSGFVALIGAPNAGKSTLLNAILEEKISITCPKPQTTRNRVAGILTRPEFQIVFLDTPGIHKAQDDFNKMLVDTALSTLSEADVICFLMEAQQAHGGVNRLILEFLENASAPVVLAINKIDLLRSKKEILPIIERYANLREFKAVIPISALLGDGTGELVAEIAKLLPEGPAYYPEDDITDQPVRFIVAELIREKVFSLTHEEIPYATAVTIDTFSEDAERRLTSIEATIHLERASQKSILIGKGGRMLKEIGQQARLDIENLLGCRIYLGLFVRITKNWRKDSRSLAEFGYRTPGR